MLKTTRKEISKKDYLKKLNELPNGQIIHLLKNVLRQLLKSGNWIYYFIRL